MSYWKVAAAQYEPRNASLTEQVAHHLEFVRLPPSTSANCWFFPHFLYWDAITNVVRFRLRPISRF